MSPEAEARGGRPDGSRRLLGSGEELPRWLAWLPDMTFRGRIVLAATTAVLVVVVLGSVATYVVAYNSLIGSVDVTLTQEAAAAIERGQIDNVCYAQGQPPCTQILANNGAVISGTGQVLPVPAAARAVALEPTRGTTFFSTTVRGTDVREIVVGLPTGYEFTTDGQLLQLDAGGALQYTTNLTGVNQELGHLALALWLIVIIGVALAVLLGLAVARTVLVPLDALTRGVEELAETTDVSQRLDPGGVDELGRLRRAFNRLLVALDTSRESQRQLVLDASHELRTPLTSLRTNMEVARRLSELAPEERDVLIGDVLTQLDELTTLVGDLAELARGEQPALTREAVRLDDIVLSAVEVATTHGRSRGVTFEARATPTWVAGSPARIGRAVDNLLDNALKWSPDGGVVEVTCIGGEVSVRDHGPGVDDADREHIFDRFYRAPSARGRPGSGLGLAIVAQVAADESGTVTVERAVGGGALFRFTLPTVPSPVPDLGPAVAAPVGHDPFGPDPDTGSLRRLRTRRAAARAPAPAVPDRPDDAPGEAEPGVDRAATTEDGGGSGVGTGDAVTVDPTRR